MARGETINLAKALKIVAYLREAFPTCPVGVQGIRLRKSTSLCIKGCLGGVRFWGMSNDKGLWAIHIAAILLWISFVDKSAGAGGSFTAKMSRCQESTVDRAKPRTINHESRENHERALPTLPAREGGPKLSPQAT